MPYIKQDSRQRFDETLESMAAELNDIGELNYCITRLVCQWLYGGGQPNYSEYNAVVGALECAKLELYRRRVAPYEAAKRVENGDVYV